jgi:predicted transport protein
VIRIYLNLDPETVKSDGLTVRDVRQVGHFGTGDLEISIKHKKDIETAADLIKSSYEAS